MKRLLSIFRLPLSAFFLALALALCLLWPQAVPAQTPPKPSPPELRGVWLTNVDSNVLFSASNLTTALQRLKRLNFNTIYPTIWQGGYTLYPSDIAQAVIGKRLDPTPGLQQRDMLAEAIATGHQLGLRIIPWFEFGLMLPADSPIAQSHPDWISQRRDRTQRWMEGQEPRLWLNPFHPQAQQFITALVAEVVARYDLDGLQFDDHLGLPSDFGYDPYTIKRYQQDHSGKAPPTDNKDPNWAEWQRWRSAQLTEFMTRLFHTIKALKPKAIVSLSPNPYDFAYSQFLQDWRTWERQGLIEELIVQVYRNDLERFRTELNHSTIQAANRHIPTGIGILVGLKNRPIAISQIRQQVELVRQQKLGGISFFFYETLGDRDRDFKEILR